jgi:hypothetical protein
MPIKRSVVSVRIEHLGDFLLYTRQNRFRGYNAREENKHTPQATIYLSPKLQDKTVPVRQEAGAAAPGASRGQQTMDGLPQAPAITWSILKGVGLDPKFDYKIEGYATPDKADDRIYIKSRRADGPYIPLSGHVFSNDNFYLAHQAALSRKAVAPEPPTPSLPERLENKAPVWGI